MLCILLFLLIEGTMFHTENGLQGIRLLGNRKIFLIVSANILFFFLILFGNYLSVRIEDTAVFRWLDIVLLACTPAVIFVIVQMIIQMCDRRSGAPTSFFKLFYSVLRMSTDAILRNLAICYFILILLLLFIKKVNIACAACTVFFVVLALVNFYVTEFRGQAFLLLDILGTGTAAEVISEYHLEIPADLGLILMYSLVFCLFQMKFQKLNTSRKTWKKTTYVLSHLAVFTVSALCVFEAVQNAGNVSFWNTNRSYRTEGYLCALVKELHYLKPEKPVGYSVERILEIAEGLPQDSTSDTAVVPQNIIMIMNESLTDFESLGDLKTDTEILPYIHSLHKNVTYGQLHVPTFGGGTARSEYEALTGNSMYFLPVGSVPYQLYVRDSECGIAQTLKSQGYSTIAVHPNKASNWNRSKVYQSMGFDEFISIENWGDDEFEKIRNFASDRTTYHKLIRLYENKKPDEKLFTFCVTMQNHGGYGTDTLNGYEPTVKLHYKKSYPKAETYLSLAKESDQAFKELLEYFEHESEPTMIIMFGDHWPKIEGGFTSELLGKSRQKLNLEETQQTYAAPYVIWTNYPSETSNQDMSSNYLSSYVLQKAGIPLNSYNRFLLNLKKELPVIGIGAVCDSEGKWYSQSSIPQKYQEMLDAYYILEYNNQFDTKNKIYSLFSPEQ